MNPALLRLNQRLAISEASKKEEKTTEVAKEEFAEFQKILKSKFKDGIISMTSNGAILKVHLTKECYNSSQEEFSAKGKENWVFDNGMALLSSMPDSDPDSYKLYFCKVVTITNGE